MARPKRLSPDAEQVAVYLTPEEQVVVHVIRGRRKKRAQPKTGLSEIVVDGLWRLLEQEEGLSQAQIEGLFAQIPRQGESKLRPFPKKQK